MLPLFASSKSDALEGKSRHAQGARQTLLRVQKKKARLAALEAKAEAERAFQRARDPRQNMPSRFTGSFTAPLSDRQPPRVDVRPLPPPPAMAAEVGSELTVMPGGPVLTGGPEELLPASEFTVIFEGEPLDLRLFIGPEDPRPWDLPEFSEEHRIRVMKVHLKMRFELVEKRARSAVRAIVSTGNGERDLENHENGGRKPVLMVVVGRQRVGKTSFLNALAQYLQERGAEFAIWDTDQMNTTNNMSVFHAQASSPSSERREDVKAWLEERFLDIAERRYDALLDVGGGDTPLSQLVEDVPVAAALAELGVRVVVVHVLGPDVADLDYLDRFERNLFTPEAVLIVRNSGLILNGRSDDVAFATLDGHAGLQRALDKGAVLVSLPRLACMSEVTDRGLSFAEAMNGKFGADGKALSIFDRLRVRKWWTDELPRVFSEIPAEWLPEMRAQATGTGG